eukprot:9473499-Pyramimonas_sp.AAC.1
MALTWHACGVQARVPPDRGQPAQALPLPRRVPPRGLASRPRARLGAHAGTRADGGILCIPRHRASREDRGRGFA